VRTIQIASASENPARARDPGERVPFAEGERQDEAEGEADGKRPAQQHRELGHARPLPARERADAHEEERRRHDRHEHRLEVRRADRDLARAERIDRQRIERPQEHRRRGGGQEHVVGQQERFS
jgi:hypothetical protein